MLVTSIEQINKLQYTVTYDYETKIVLYKGDLMKSSIEVGSNMTSEKYNILIEKVILKRAKSKLLQLLKISDKSENELRMKLKQKYYFNDVIDKAIDYAKSYGYIDDTRYVNNIIKSRITKKSKREIVAYLRGKGVSSELIEEAFQNTTTDESDVIRKLLAKKIASQEEVSYEKSCKLYGYLIRKGFSPSLVMHCLNEISLYKNEADSLSVL